jgi:protein-tyrosine kinase
MSRIREALTKAATERAKHADVSGDFADIAAEVRRPAAAAAVVDPPRIVEARPEPQVNVGPISVGPTTFEDLLRKCKRPEWKLDPRVNLFAPGAKERAGAERFRTLRSRLYQIAETRPLRRVLITSSVPSEGKSFVCANLAQAIVHRQDRKVLLIDADLRKPTLHQVLSAPKTPGLTNYLRGEVDEFAVIQKGSQSNLFFIPAGDEVGAPSELLLNDRMKKLLDFGSELFDWVIVDSPPALPVHDPSMLASLCDGVLFVIRAASTDVDMATKASAEFRQKNLLGVVFNHIEKGESYGNNYYQ